MAYFIFLIGFVCLIASRYLFAQETRTDRDVFERQTAETKEVAAKAAQAKKKAALERLRKISFSQILDQPDDVELNYEYAKQQVAENNLLGAATTLERILLINPDLPKVRLFYAIVLFRLDNLIESERELDALASLEIPASLREEIKIYQREISLRKKMTRFGIRQSNGFQFDSNRNSAPSSKFQLLAETPLGLEGTNRRQTDNSFLNVTTLDVSHDLGFDAGHELIGSFTYFLQEQTEVDELDLGAFQHEYGARIKTRYFNLTPTFYASHVLLSREQFLRTQGGNINVDRNFGRWDWGTQVRIEHQDFSNITENDVARQRTGNEFSLNNGLGFSLTPNIKLTTHLDFAKKWAKEDFNGYRHLLIGETIIWLLGKGQFLLNSFELELDKYDEVDTAIAGRIRRDKALRESVTYGAPLDLFFLGHLPRSIKDMTVSVTYEYFRSLSNITNYSYTNNKVQAMLAKVWEF